MTHRRNSLALLILGLLPAACTDAGRSDRVPTSTGWQATDGDSGADPEPEGSTGSDDEDPEKFDVGDGGGGEPPCVDGEDCEVDCEVPPHTACDGDTTDPVAALGLNCDGEPVVDASVEGSPEGRGVLPKLGPTTQWLPREGSAIAVLGTGKVADLSQETPDGDIQAAPTHCNDDLGIQYDRGTDLPAPLSAEDVGGDCTTDAALIGMGDCSNSIQEQFSQGVSANDYSEIRFTATVPKGSDSISYDLAFFSTEYPFYYFSEFNDMYVGWLESESWTGNISFDEYGNPISLNASFLDFRDDAGDLPELAGTCMRYHAGTRWLTTTAPVTPGETITVVFAIFDLSDSILDSYVLLDNWQWGCEGPDKPSTKPVG